MAAAAELTSKELLDCSLPSWYEKFKAVTIKSTFIPLPKEFISYLNEDGIVLPEGYSLPVTGGGENGEEDNWDDNDWNDTDGTDDEVSSQLGVTLKEMEEAIASLGGAILPKLNWSIPRDAVWITATNSLRCTCVAEILLLLKSSTLISHDIAQADDLCKLDPQFSIQLCLREWTNFHPSSEFRCFVKCGQLVAICQRNLGSYYHSIHTHKDAIGKSIVAFFSKEISDKFSQQNYVFDVFRSTQGGLRLMDFNPFSPSTDPLLFSWEELTTKFDDCVESELPVFRALTSECHTFVNSYSQMQGLPQDFVDLASGEDPYKLIDFLSLTCTTQENSSLQSHGERN